MSKFALNEMQDKRVQSFMEKHFHEKHPKGVRDSSGACLEFHFLPGGDGMNVTFECIYCRVKMSLTIDADDTGEFFSTTKMELKTPKFGEKVSNMSGIRNGGMRPKRAKNLASRTEKKFRKNDDETRARYAEKLAKRASRKIKKKNRKK